MSNPKQFPLASTLVTNTSSTTNGTSSAFSMPIAQSYRLALECSTFTGTTPTLDVIILTSLDGGTVYDEVLKFTQITQNIGRQMIFHPMLSYGEVATEGSMGMVAGVELTAGAAVVNNGPIDPAHMKIRWLIGGTTPNFTFAVKMLAVPFNLYD